ncbi:MAG: hypothetical protein ACPG7F_03440 [Aggregatilineales bacterium]
MFKQHTSELPARQQPTHGHYRPVNFQIPGDRQHSKSDTVRSD